MIPKTLIDQYQRHLSYLRISITDRCNLRCIYCMPREMIPKLEHADVLRYEEILRVARVAAGLLSDPAVIARLMHLGPTVTSS